MMFIYYSLSQSPSSIGSLIRFRLSFLSSLIYLLPMTSNFLGFPILLDYIRIVLTKVIPEATRAYYIRHRRVYSLAPLVAGIFWNYK